MCALRPKLGNIVNCVNQGVIAVRLEHYVDVNYGAGRKTPSWLELSSTCVLHMYVATKCRKGIARLPRVMETGQLRPAALE